MCYCELHVGDSADDEQCYILHHLQDNRDQINISVMNKLLYNEQNYSHFLEVLAYHLLEDRRIDDVINIFLHL